jgi:Pectate lyase superfamily protein
MPKISQADPPTRKALLERSLSDWYNVIHFGADPTGIADSRASIQQAIDAASSAGGGTIYIPEGIYLLSAPLVLSDRHGVTLLGSRPAPAFTQVCPDLGGSISTGTWLRPVSLGATNGIELNTDAHPSQTGAISNAAILNIGFYCFAECIKGGGYNRHSFGFGRLQDLLFVGKNGATVHTQHALDLANFQHTQINYVKAWDCMEPFRFSANSSTCSPGNSVVIEPYAYMNQQSSGNFGIGLFAESGSQALNAITIIRPQVNWFQATAPGSGKANIVLSGAGGSATVSNCSLYDCDTEGPNDAHIKCVNTANIYLGIGSVTPNATASVLLTNHSGVIVSASPDVTIKATDDASAVSTVATGRIKQMLGIPLSGFRYEQASHAYVLAVGHNNRCITLPENTSETCARLTNMQIVEGLTEFVGSGNHGTLARSAAGTILVNCNHTTNPFTFYLPPIDSLTYGIEYEFIFKSTNGGACQIRCNAGNTVEGNAGYDLAVQWQKVRLKACNDNVTWVVLYGDGARVP